MSQESVKSYLKKHRGHRFTSKQIAYGLALSPGSVCMSLKKLRKNDEIGYEKVGESHECHVYWHKDES